MKSSSEALALRGDLLSCYTASIAAYLERNQIDYELVLGTQLFLAVNVEPAETPRFSFVHYHTPLLGDTAIHSLHLARESAAEPQEAARRIGAEWRRSGAVIVLGDAMNLPWLVTCGRKHAPHWFLIADIDEQAGQLQIVDQFEFTDAGGVQLPFVGNVELGLLPALCRANPLPKHVFAARDRWAFGVCDSGATGAEHQWFVQQAPPSMQPVGAALLWDRLRTTWLYNSGQRRRDDLPVEWSCGVAAIRLLAEQIERALDDPALYEISDDLWVAARNRQLFTQVLRRLARELSVEELEELAIWGEAELVPQWHAVPRVMHYNLGSLQRGRRPTGLLVQTLQTVADLEAQLMERLGEIVGR
ncbi:MAG TPA: hypothetical protein VGD69_00930 [Herpetosiphonaceae bacterium]